MSEPWTKEELTILEEMWGNISIPAIAKKLNRTINAVKVKAIREGLGRHIHRGEYITFNQLLTALGISYSYCSERLIKSGIPVKHKKSINMKYKIIYINDFWKWLEQNKMLIDLSKLEYNVLGPEPDWVAEKRKADQLANKYKTTPWTNAEDVLLKEMLKSYRYSYREISIRLLRTEGAIKRRMKDLKIKQRPLIANKYNPWTPEDEAILIDLYYKGYIGEIIAERIPKSASAIRAKIEQMVKKELLTPNRVPPKVPKVTCESRPGGISFKEVLPEEKWPKIDHFLRALSHVVTVSGITQIDINNFIKVYTEIY